MVKIIDNRSQSYQPPTDNYQGLVDSFGSPINSRKGAKAEVSRLRSVIQQYFRAKYDSAQTTLGNEIHWSQSDLLDPHAANSLSVRKKIRSRSRYEVIENNCYLKGMLLTIANDFAGSGPRLQITDDRFTRERRRLIELRYQQRSEKIKLRQKLWRWRIARTVDGESVGVAFTNSRLEHGVTLDWEIIETDQLSSPFGTEMKVNEIDGVRFDENFQPTEYHVLNEHPGSMFMFSMNKLVGQWIAEQYVIHWFRKDRPWLRGISETAPCLPLCAILRRYTLAVLRAAEFAADVSGVLKTSGPPNSNFWQQLETLGSALGGDEFPMERGMFLTLPWDHDLVQIDAKHPMQVYDVFVNAILREIARPLLMPYNRAVGSSKDSNMASGVVDEQTYKTAIETDRYDGEDEVLNKDLGQWWKEGSRTPGYFDEPIVKNGKRISLKDDFRETLDLNPSLRQEVPRHVFRWDQVGIVHTDPKKVSDSRQIDWSGGFRPDQDIIERDFNMNYDDWVEMQREAIDNRKNLGLSLPSSVVPTSAGSEIDEPDDDSPPDAGE